MVDALEMLGVVALAVLGGFCLGHNVGYKKAWMEVKNFYEKGK